MALLYTYVLWLIGRHDFGLDLKTLRGVIARWFFMAHTTSRYTGSHETQFEARPRSACNVRHSRRGKPFCDELDRLVRATLTTDYWDISLPNRLDTAAGRSPVLSAYQAALNLLDAEVLFSDLRIRGLLDTIRNFSPARWSGTICSRGSTLPTRASRGCATSTPSPTWPTSTGPRTRPSEPTTPSTTGPP